MGAVLASTIGAFWGYQMWNRPHREYAEESAVVSLEARDVLDLFQSDAASAMAQYGNQIVEIKGTIRSISSDLVVFDAGVACRWEAGTSPTGWLSGDVHKVKARILAYDDLMEEVTGDFAVPVD
ncbi:MAG: OB-fold protein [Flavobacteriales bacterium]